MVALLQPCPLSSILQLTIIAFPIIRSRVVVPWLLSIRKISVPRSAGRIRVVGLRRLLCFYTVASILLHSVMASQITILCIGLKTEPHLRPSQSLVVHPHACTRFETFIRWPSGEQAVGIATVRRCQLTCGAYCLRHGRPRMISNLSSRSSTTESSPYCTSSSIYVILITRYFTVTDAPVALRTVILAGGISRSMNLNFAFI